MAEPLGTTLTPPELLAHSGWVKRLARELMANRESAEDLVQDVWLAAIEHPPKHSASLAGWFRTLMRRAAARRRSSDRARVERESRSGRNEAAPSTADLVMQAEGQRQITGLVLELPDPYRSTLLLRYFADLTLAEIARKTGTPAATVRVHHQRALEELRRLLAARGKSDPEAWRASSAFLVSAVVGAKAGAAASAAGMGVLIMTGKAKLALGIGLLAALAMLTVWIPWTAGSLDDSSRAKDRDAARSEPAAGSAGGSKALASGESEKTERGIATTRFDGGRALIGRVVDPDGAPVGGATVVAYPSTRTELITGEFRDRPKGWPRVAKSEPDGSFAIADLGPTPILEVVATSERFEPGLVSPAPVNESILLTLGGGIRLRGHVRDFGGAAIAGARIQINEISGLVQAEREALSGTDGAYSIGGLSPRSRFYIEVGAEGFATQWINYIPPADAAGVAVKDFYLGRGVEITAIAVDADTGAPIPDARILAWAFTLAHAIDRVGGTVLNPKHVRVLADVRTGPDGRARVAHVPSWGVDPTSFEQRHQTESQLGGIAAIADGHAIASDRIDVLDEGANKTVTLRCPASGTIAGRVVDESGQPVAGAHLWFQAASAGFDWGLPGPLRAQPEPSTGLDGTYLLRMVPLSAAGEVDGVISASRGDSTATLYEEGQVAVRMNGREIARAPDIVIKSRKASKAMVRVVDPEGSPVWGARIDQDAFIDPVAVTGPDGRAEWPVEDPKPDDVSSPTRLTVWARLRGFPPKKIVLDLPPRKEIVVTLERGHRIAGRIIHPDGSPAAKAWITASTAEYTLDETFPPHQKHGEPWVESKGEQAGVGGSDASGAFEIVDLEPGIYHLEARIAFGNQDFVRQTAASVRTGTTDLVITIPRPPADPKGTLTVNVRERGTKAPVLRCNVRLKSDWRGATAIAVAPGRFVATKLGPGRWSVTVRAPRYAGIEPIEVDVPESAEPATVDVELERGVAFRGKVKAPGVTAFTTPRGWLTGPGAPVMDIGADGAYTISGLTAGASYDLIVSHVPRVNTGEVFVMPAKLRVPDEAADVVERDLDLVPAGGLAIRIRAPRMFDPLGRTTKSDEQWRLARESRLTVRRAGGEVVAEWKPITGDNYGFQLPLGDYIVRLEAAGADPQEKTVTITRDVVYADFTVP